MIELKPREIGYLAIIAMLFTFVILLIQGKEDGGCNIIGVSSLPACSSSIDLSPNKWNSCPKVPAPCQYSKDEYHDIPEPSSLYLFGAGGGLLATIKWRNGSRLWLNRST